MPLPDLNDYTVLSASSFAEVQLLYLNTKSMYRRHASKLSDKARGRLAVMLISLECFLEEYGVSTAPLHVARPK